MSNIPAELKYIASHEWLRLEDDGTITVGITDHAQDLLGDVVFVELPDVGDTIAVDDEISVVESVKAASDVYAPISGEVVAINEALEDDRSNDACFWFKPMLLIVFENQHLNKAVDQLTLPQNFQSPHPIHRRTLRLTHYQDFRCH